MIVCGDKSWKGGGMKLENEVEKNWQTVEP